MTRRTLLVVATLGYLAGLWILVHHLQADPLADVHAYYDAGTRLNGGQPLYPPGADTNVADFYRYPPLLAIVFRPLALLPFSVAAATWGIAIVATFVLTIRLLGVRTQTFVAIGLLAWPIGWSLAIGQAQVLVTLLTIIGTPAAIAVAANIKLFPVFVGLYWLGRRDWRSVRSLVAWGLGLLCLQLVLEPTGTIVFLGFPNLEQVGQVNNISPYAISPVLWIALIAAGTLVALWLAPTRWGWPAAVAVSVLATPRLITYQLMTLVAAVRVPDAATEALNNPLGTIRRRDPPRRRPAPAAAVAVDRSE